MRPSRQVGLYGPLKAWPPTNAGPSRASRPLEDTGWAKARFALLQTELSPAILVRSESSYLGLFGDMAAHGLEGPRYVAFSSRAGPRSFRLGEPLDLADMEECWVVVWFAGARGWVSWDCPWAVFLQRKPLAMKLDARGLELQFRAAAGEIVLMPLYGYQKPPQQDQDFQTTYGLPADKIKTWRWKEFLSRELLLRVRYWAGLSRALPIAWEETWSVDPAQDTITSRQRFQYHLIEDDWHTPPVRLAPLSPLLALARQGGRFPVRVSLPVVDLDYATPYGPYQGAESADSYDAVFSVLQYVHETEAADPPNLQAHAVVPQALERLRSTAQQQSNRPDLGLLEDASPSHVWTAALESLWFAKGLPYCPPNVQSNVQAGLRRFLEREVLIPDRFAAREYPLGSGYTDALWNDSGAGEPESSLNPSLRGASLLPPLWAYAHFSGDWDLVQQRWDLIKNLRPRSAGSLWAGLGCEGVIALGDDAAPALALARMAYRVGDGQSYVGACAQFARAALHHHVKLSGADYFLKRQPWHSREALPKDACLTELRVSEGGWQLAAREDWAKPSRPSVDNRWARFNSEDVARLDREILGQGLKDELVPFEQRGERTQRFQNDPHALPSLVQLRSLLLNDAPGELASLAAPDQFTGPAAGAMASCWAVLRSSRGVRLERLIPAGGGPSPFISCQADGRLGPNASLVCRVATAQGESGWPWIVGWPPWSTPTGAPWTFGRVTPSRDPKPQQLRELSLNATTRVILLDGP